MGLPTQALHCKVDSVKISPNVDMNLLQLGVHDALLSGPLIARFKVSFFKTLQLTLHYSLIKNR